MWTRKGRTVSILKAASPQVSSGCVSWGQRAEHGRALGHFLGSMQESLFTAQWGIQTQQICAYVILCVLMLTIFVYFMDLRKMVW